MLRAAFVSAVVVLATAAPAGAHDSLAPAGARHGWLPGNEPWVMQHWVPFDEARLYEALGVDNRELEIWMRDDHRTIGQLARQRTKMTTKEFADHLIAPWRGAVSAGQRAVLRERTMRMLTQGHLAQHVLFHYFHGTMALPRTQKLFGVGRRTYQRLRIAAWTPLQIGGRGGRTPAEVSRGMTGLLGTYARVGVTERAQTPAQADFMLQRRMALLPCFLKRPMPKHDPGNPYGDPNNGHGPHERQSRIGLLDDSKEARARDHATSCWHEPALATTTPPAPVAAAAPSADDRKRRDVMLCTDLADSASGAWW